MRALLVTVALTWLSGCLESRTGTCGDLVCPVGRTCDTNRQTCVLPAQMEACLGQAEQAECSFPGVSAGGCDHGVCHAVVCGNGVAERGEACDDENTVDLDGCNRTCSSDESCGNGVIDQLRGEECDDENPVSHDGCASSCKSEVPTWEELTPRDGPGIQGAAMAYDAARARVVRFGGYTPTSDDTHQIDELDGERWTERDDVGVPPGRRNHVMVYDTDRRRLVVFGGSSRGAILGETWIVDPSGWQQLPGPGPSARELAAGAYVPGEHRLLLFGGRAAGGAVNGETWALGAAGWQQLSPASSPPARADHRMVYDAQRGRVVLFGGKGASAALFDTWEWTGDDWSPVTTSEHPPASGAMAYHAGRQRTVLFGGDDATGNADQTWEYDGAEWTRITTTSTPGTRRHHVMAYDPLAKQVVLVDGGISVQGAAIEDTWVYDGQWRDISAELEDDRQPAARIAAAFAYDPIHQQMFLTGGAFPPPAPGQPGTPLGETWSFDGDTWREPHLLRSLPPAGGSPHGTAGMVWDAKHQRIVLVRPGPGMGAPMATWVFDGNAWWQLQTMVSPPIRSFAALAYDGARGKVVLFGGEAMMAARNDTWELDGDAWTEVTPTVSPPARAEMGVAYDAARGKLVIYGGRGPGMMAAPVDDTWEYDGTTWTEVVSSVSPGPRSDTTMAYHPLRGKVVLWGGINPPMPYGDVWEYDGATWSPVALSGGPAPKRYLSADWDPARKQLVFAGGDPTTETWSLAYRSSLPDEICAPGPEPLSDRDGDGLVGCDDPDCDAVACADGHFACRAGACECVGGASEKLCGDAFDDDCDGIVDCADSDCAGVAPCQAEGSCSDGLDDDEDGRADCLDPGCAGTAGCEAYEASCADGKDNDGDGTIDCADLDCYLVACPEVLP